MTSWEFLAGPATSAPTTQLTTARDRSLSFKLTDPSTAGFTIDGRHDEAVDLIELGTDVHALRNGAPLYTGRLGATSDDLDADGHTVTCATADVRALLARRITTRARTYSATDVATFVRDMFLDAQDETSAGAAGSNLRITVPTFAPTGKLLTRNSPKWGPIGTELAEAQAAGVDAGSALFDYDVSPGWSAPTVRLWAQRGRDLTSGDSAVILDFVRDPGNPRSSLVQKITRAFDPATYANLLRVTGGSSTTANLTASQAAYVIKTADGVGQITAWKPGDPDDPTTPEVDESTPDLYTVTITPTPTTLTDGSTAWTVGVWALAEDKSELTTQSGLNAYAAARLAELRRPLPSYRVTLRRNAWGGPDHVWLGDTIRVLIRDGRLVEDVRLRVREVNVTPGPNGEEDVDLVVGPPTTFDPFDLLLAHSKTIAATRRATATGTVPT